MYVNKDPAYLKSLSLLKNQQLHIHCRFQALNLYLNFSQIYAPVCFVEAKIYYIYFFRVTINTKTTKTTKPSKKLVIIHRFGIYVIYLPNLILLFVHYTTYLPKLVLYFNSFLKISILVFGIIRFYQTFPSWQEDSNHFT